MPAPTTRLASEPTDIRRGITAYAGQGGGPAAIALYGVIGVDFRAKDLATALAQYSKAKTLDIYVHSAGGSVLEGLAMYNILDRFEGHKRVYIDGIAASMMSVVICAADEILMPENTQIMVHLPRIGPNDGGLVADELRDLADALDGYGERMLDAYMRRTKLPREQLLEMTRKETYLSAMDALSLGFADSVMLPLDLVAQINLDSPETVAMPDTTVITTPATAPTQEPTVPNTAQPQAIAAPVVSEAEVLAKVQAAEATRRTGITTAFGAFAVSHADLLNACLLDMKCTVDQAQAKLLARLAEDTTPSAGPQGRSGANAHIHASNGNLVGDSVRASVMARAGHAEIEAGNNYNHMSLRELARASLVDRGVGVATLNPMQMVGLAFTHTTSDFGIILMDVAHRSMLAGWDLAEETFQLWTKKGELSDFKTVNRIGLGEFPSLRQVREGAEYKYITIGENSQKIALATYGEVFSITRQAIINDDMNLLSDIPRKMGMAAKATIGDLVYGVLIANAALADGVALFHATHKNLQTGAGSALSVDSLDKARSQMRTQKTSSGSGAERPLNIRPAYVLTPVGLESKARQLITSSSVPTAQVNAGVTNPIQNFAEVIGEPRLDDASATAWYLAAQQGSDTIEVAYLNGVDTPYMEQQQGFTVDGVATKVRIDAGVAPLDFRGLQKANGA
jgi:ATP-dependent protease ClpP protease subunit